MPLALVVSELVTNAVKYAFPDGREGTIRNVIVGDATKLDLPDVGRLRGGPSRFRGLRLVHTHLRNEALSRDDLVDLALLRLDLVAAVGVTRDGRPADSSTWQRST